MCEVIEVSRSGFYKWSKKQQRRASGREKYLLFLIKEAFEQSHKTYGYRRVYKKLKQCNVYCYKNQIQKIMKENSIWPKRKRKFKLTTDSRHNLRISPNLVNRNFDVKELNIIWVGDITYIWTKEGWLYLSTVIDLCSKRVVGYSTGNRINKELIIRSMKNALKTRRPKPGLIFHSDQGSQYASDEFRKVLSDNNVRQSMSRKGDCWDNAVAESFFKTIKCELVYWHDFRSRNEAELRIFEYIEMFYNTNRLHSSIGYVAPATFENQINLLTSCPFIWGHSKNSCIGKCCLL